MWKPLSINAHGFIDYAFALTLPLLPEVVGFKRNRIAKGLSRSVGVIVLGYSAVTKARWGFIKILPFKVHLSVDIGVNCVLIAAPWMAGLSADRKARNTIIISGLLGLAASLLTNAESSLEKEDNYLFL